MNDRKHRTVHAIAVVSGDSHIMIVQIRGKWMGTDPHNALFKVKSHVIRQIFRRLSLPVFRIITSQKTILDRLSMISDFPDQRNYHLF